MRRFWLLLLMITHTMTATIARKLFVRGLVGVWHSWLGNGLDMNLGMQLTFREDGSGKMEEWGLNYDPEYISTPDFQWRTVSDCTIDITHCGVTRIVRYDFKTCKDQYGVAELRVFDTGKTPDEHGDIGFWLSPFSLVYGGPEKPATGVLTRLWEKLTH